MGENNIIDNFNDDRYLNFGIEISEDEEIEICGGCLTPDDQFFL